MKKMVLSSSVIPCPMPNGARNGQKGKKNNTTVPGHGSTGSSQGTKAEMPGTGTGPIILKKFEEGAGITY